MKKFFAYIFAVSVLGFGYFYEIKGSLTIETTLDVFVGVITYSALLISLIFAYLEAYRNKRKKQKLGILLTKISIAVFGIFIMVVVMTFFIFKATLFLVKLTGELTPTKLLFPMFFTIALSLIIIHKTKFCDKFFRHIMKI